MSVLVFRVQQNMSPVQLEENHIIMTKLNLNINQAEHYVN